MILISFSETSTRFLFVSEVQIWLHLVQALHLQMLTMRNGLSLHPGYSLGSLQSMLAPSAGLEMDEGNPLLNPNRPGTDTFSRDQDVFLQTPLEPTNHASSTLPMLMPSTSHTHNPGILPSYVPPVQNRYGLANHLPSTKVFLGGLAYT